MANNNKLYGRLAKQLSLGLSVLFWSASQSFAQPANVHPKKAVPGLVSPLGNELCVTPRGPALSPYLQNVALDALKILDLSPTGHHVSRDIRTHNRAMCLDDNRPVGQDEYRAPSHGFMLDGSASISDDLADLRTALSEAREYRYRDTEDRGYRLSVDYDPQHMALLGKLKEADAVAYMAQVAHELKAIGYNVDEALEDKFERAIFAAYEAEVKSDSLAAFDGRARRAAFEAWFDVVPAQIYEARYLDQIEGIVNAHASRHVPMGFKVLTSAQAIGIGATQEGTNYLEQTGGINAQAPRYFEMMNDANRQRMQSIREKIAAVIPGFKHSPFVPK